MEIFTKRDYLEKILELLNAESDKKYTIKYFKRPIQYFSYGTKHDYPVEGNNVEEGVICITTEEFDVESIFQGYLCYPEEYPEFYEKGDFILCYGPSKKYQDFEEVMNQEANLCCFYGLKDEIFEKIIKNTQVRTRKQSK